MKKTHFQSVLRIYFFQKISKFNKKFFFSPKFTRISDNLFKTLLQ